MKSTWQELANLFATLPSDEQGRYMSAIGALTQELRRSIGIIFAAETALRQVANDTPEFAQWLDSIRRANQRAIGLVTDFAQPFERGITLPFNRPSASPSPE
jgi:hypothetical protein